MKKTESTFASMVTVLVAVAVITGCLLAYVQKVTEGPKREQQAESLTADIKKVMCDDNVVEKNSRKVTRQFDNKDYTFVIHEITDSKGNDKGNAVESTTMGFGGELTILVGFDTDGNITGYSVRQTSETPGLGIKASEWFQKGAKGDITGKNPQKCNLTPTKDGGEVDAITASTITTRAFLKAVRQASEAVK